MPSKLLTATALFVTSTATAGPPVDTRRVTGNVSAEHQPAREKRAEPPIDTCRVTGNLVPQGKSARGDQCLVRFADTSVVVPLGEGLLTRASKCELTGVRVERDATAYCSLERPNADPVEVPLDEPTKQKES